MATCRSYTYARTVRVLVAENATDPERIAHHAVSLVDWNAAAVRADETVSVAVTLVSNDVQLFGSMPDAVSVISDGAVQRDRLATLVRCFGDHVAWWHDHHGNLFMSNDTTLAALPGWHEKVTPSRGTRAESPGWGGAMAHGGRISVRRTRLVGWLRAALELGGGDDGWIVQVLGATIARRPLRVWLLPFLQASEDSDVVRISVDLSSRPGPGHCGGCVVFATECWKLAIRTMNEPAAAVFVDVSGSQVEP